MGKHRRRKQLEPRRDLMLPLKGLPVRAKNGRDLEAEIFTVSGDRLIREFKGLTPLPAVLRRARLNQPSGWNPLQPPTKIGRSFFWQVDKWLTEEKKRTGEVPALYVAVTDPEADQIYGIDAWFVFGKRIATIDVSRRDKEKLAQQHGLRLKPDFVLTRRAIKTGTMKYLCWHIAQRLLGRTTRAKAQTRKKPKAAPALTGQQLRAIERQKAYQRPMGVRRRPTAVNK